MAVFNLVSLTPALLEEARLLLADDPYSGVIDDLVHDLRAGRGPACVMVARDGVARDASLLGIAILHEPSAPGAPWTMSVMTPREEAARTPELFDRIVVEVPPGVAVEWWTRGPLVEASALLAKTNGFEAGRRIEIMSRNLTDPIDAELLTRSLRREDADRLAEVNNAAFAEHGDRSSWTGDTVLSELARFENRFVDLLVTPTEGPIMGFHWTRLIGPGLGEVYVLATHPDAHGSGLSRRLLDTGLAHLQRTYGVKRTILYVDADNAHAIRLYERNGFENLRQPLVSFHKQF